MSLRRDYGGDTCPAGSGKRMSRHGSKGIQGICRRRAVWPRGSLEFQSMVLAAKCDPGGSRLSNRREPIGLAQFSRHDSESVQDAVLEFRQLVDQSLAASGDASCIRLEGDASLNQTSPG